MFGRGLELQVCWCLNEKALRGGTCVVVGNGRPRAIRGKVWSGKGLVLFCFEWCLFGGIRVDGETALISFSVLHK